MRNEAIPEAKSIAPEQLQLDLETTINLALRRNRALGDSRDAVVMAGYTLVGAESEFELKITPAAGARISGYSGEDNYDSQELGMTVSKELTIGTRGYVTPLIIRRDSGIEEYEAALDTFLVQPLLRGLSPEYNLAGVLAAEYGERTAARSLYLARVDTMLKAVRNVYEIIRLRDILRLNEEAAQRLEGYAAAARSKEKIGLASPIDVYRAEIQLNQALETLALTRQSYLDSIDRLKVLLTLSLETELKVTAPLDYRLVRVDEAEAVRTALFNRVEIDQARDNISEAERRARHARHGILPSLDLELSYRRFGENEDFGRSFRFDRESWGVGLAAEGDLWRTREKAEYQRRLLSVRMEKRDLTFLRDTVQLEVLKEARDLKKAAQTIKIQREQIRQAEGKLELSRIKFRHGMADNFDLIESERELLRAQTRLLNAVTGYIVSTYRFKAALGTLIEKPPIRRES